MTELWPAGVRILHITNAGGFGRLQRGGGERAVEELSAAFSETPGWTAAVLAPPAFLESASLSEEVQRIPVALEELSVKHALRGGSELRRAIAEYAPTVVLTHLLRGTLIGLPAARLGSRAGTISNLHNSLRDSVRHGGGGPSGYANLLAFRSIGRLASAHVAISPSNEADLIHHDRIPRRKVVLIPNWVSPAFTELDVEAAVAASELAAFDGQTLLVVGRLEEQKRQAFAIELLPKLPATTRLVLAGDGALRAQLEAQARELGVAERVTFLGQRVDVPELMAAADVVLVPSSFEGFGRVAIEALSVGTRVLAADVAGLRDVLTGAPQGAAALLPGDDPAAWLTALAGPLGERAAGAPRAAMRAFALERYSLASSVQRYRELAARGCIAPSQLLARRVERFGL